MMRFVVQLLGHVRLFAIPWTAACQAPKSTTISLSLLKFMCIELVMLSNHPELVLRIRWPKYWNFSFSISPSNEYLVYFLQDLLKES